MNKQELINKLAAEEPTPGRWQAICSEKDDDTSASIMVLKPEAADKPHQAIGLEDVTYVAHFARPADARRVMACLKQFEGMSTDAIDTMPTSIIELVAARISLSHMVRDVAQAAAGTDDEWAECRENFRRVHEARMEAERQMARPN